MITHARPHALLLVAEGRIERHQYDGSATESHDALPRDTARGAARGRGHYCSTQPSPGIQRTAWPFARSTRSPSPSGRPANHSRSPASASA